MSETDTFFRIERILAAQAEANKQENPDELANLLGELPQTLPKEEDPDFQNYLLIQQRISALKERMIRQNNELLEELRNEERLGRELAFSIPRAGRFCEFGGSEAKQT